MESGSPRKQGVVLRNTAILVAAQLAGAPLAIVVNAAMGRYLGPAALGYAYLAWQFTQFGFLLVDWGHSGVLPALVARDRSRAGEALGTSLVWRLGASAVMGAALAGGSLLFGYPPSFQIVLALVVLQSAITSITGGFQDAVRGFERTDVAALGQLGQQLLTAMMVIPALLLGGKLNTVLAIQAVSGAVMLVVVAFAARRAGLTRLTFRKEVLRHLFGQGATFLTFGVAMAFQANVDAVMLSKLSPVEVVGWHAAARRLSGMLMIPATALISALYPTLARLHHEGGDGYRDTVRGALRGTIALAVPLALCCGLYRRVGVRFFGEDKFAPAEQNLVVHAVLLFLVYVSMPLGTAIMAAGRQRLWAAVQSVCIVVSITLDPILIPLFQRRYGNGGLGLSVAGVISEVLMVSAALFLMPRGVVDRSVGLALLRVSVAGAAMAGAAYALRTLTPYVAAPVTVALYVGCLWAIGGLDPEQLAAARAAVKRRLGRPRPE